MSRSMLQNRHAGQYLEFEKRLRLSGVGCGSCQEPQALSESSSHSTACSLHSPATDSDQASTPREFPFGLTNPTTNHSPGQTGRGDQRVGGANCIAPEHELTSFSSDESMDNDPTRIIDVSPNFTPPRSGRDHQTNLGTVFKRVTHG
jgi:hypothetical protein